MKKNKTENPAGAELGQHMRKAVINNNGEREREENRKGRKRKGKGGRQGRHGNKESQRKKESYEAVTAL